MTALHETRFDHEGHPYEVLVPIVRASDLSFDKWFVEQLREWLHRRGIRADHIPDEQLLFQVRNTFGNMPPRRSRR